MFVVAAALLGLIALLATLQYRWLGRISDAERDGMKATLNTRASAFAQDFDSELTRAYLLFQVEPMPPDGNVAARMAARYDRWQGTARYPRLIKDVYLTAGDVEQPLQRFNPGTRFLEPAEWPASMRELRAQLRTGGERAGADGLARRADDAGAGVGAACPRWSCRPRSSFSMRAGRPSTVLGTVLSLSKGRRRSPTSTATTWSSAARRRCRTRCCCSIATT